MCITSSCTGKLNFGVPETGRTTQGFGTLKCYHCDVEPVVLRHCKAIAIYVLSDNGMSRLFLHQGTHYHPFGEGISRTLLKSTREMVQNFVSQVLTAGPRQVQVGLAKQIVLQSVVNSSNNENQKKMGPYQLDALLDELEPLVYTKR